MYLVATPLNTLHFRLPFTSIQRKSTLSSDSCKYHLVFFFFFFSFFFFLYYLQFRLCRENTRMEQTNVLFCCIVHFICAESVTQWIDNIKPFSLLSYVYIYLFML